MTFCDLRILIFADVECACIVCFNIVVGKFIDRLRYGGLLGKVIAVITMTYMTLRSVLTFWAWLTVLGIIPQGSVPPVVGAHQDPLILELSSCPARCACFGTTVDCADRGLKKFPRGVPQGTQRL